MSVSANRIISLKKWQAEWGGAASITKHIPPQMYRAPHWLQAGLFMPLTHFQTRANRFFSSIPWTSLVDEINKLPLEMQIQTIRLLVKRVTVSRKRIAVALHELPVSDLDRALNGCAPGRAVLGSRPVSARGEGGCSGGLESQSRRSLRRREHNTTGGPDHPQLGVRTAVAEWGEDWRGHRSQFQTLRIPPFVPPPGKVDYIAPFERAWPIAMARIANGEGIVREGPSAATSAPGGGPLQ